MKDSKVLKIILFISGLIAIGVGAAILFAPVAFYASSGITLGTDISILNEIRAGGGGIMVIGILIMSGAFIADLAFTSAITSMLMYLSYGASRIISFIVDGLPVDALIQVAVLEIIVGLVSFFALLKYKEYGCVKG